MQLVLPLFIIIPITEVVVLMKVGSIFGVLNTILLVLLTAVIGVTLLKKQGLATLMTANQKMQMGQMPASEMTQGIMLAVAGALLLTPGFVTDTFGFLLLTPGVRLWIANKLVKAFVMQGSANFQKTEFHYRQSGQAYHRQEQDNDVIDGEFQDVTPEKDRLEK